MNYSVLRILRFRQLWLAQAISQLGDAFYFIFFMFMVRRETGSDALVGAVGALEALPFLLVGPYAGVVVDRLDRKQILLLSDLCSGLALLAFGAVVYVNGKPPVWALLTIPFALSCFRCFFMPARAAATPALVPEELVMQANAVSSMTATTVPLLGLSISAVGISSIYALAPMRFYLTAVGLNAISFFVSAYFLTALPSLRPERSDIHSTAPMTDLRDGFRYVRSRRELVVLTALIAVFRLSVAPFFIVYLSANDRWFGGKPGTIAWFEFTFFLGMSVATPWVGRAHPKRPLLWFSFGLMAVGFGVTLMAFTPWFWWFIALNGICGLGIPVADIPVLTYLQLSVPDGYRGRVNAVRETIATGVMPIGQLLGGLVVQRFGLVAGFAAMGGGMILSCFIGLADPAFRTTRMPEPTLADPPILETM